MPGCYYPHSRPQRLAQPSARGGNSIRSCKMPLRRDTLSREKGRPTHMARRQQHRLRIAREGAPKATDSVEQGRVARYREHAQSRRRQLKNEVSEIANFLTWTEQHWRARLTRYGNFADEQRGDKGWPHDKRQGLDAQPTKRGKAEGRNGLHVRVSIGENGSWLE